MDLFESHKALKKMIAALLLVGLVALARSSAAAETAAESQDDAAQTSEPAKPQGQGHLQDVIIKGGDKSGVASEKPPLNIEMNADEAVLNSIEIEDDLLRRQPESLKNPRAGYLETLANKRVILPARNRLAKDPVKIFYPLREIMALSPSLSQEIGTGWELVITDSDGRSFRKFSGSSLPPALIQWNGRGEKGDIISVGKTYSIVINYKDTNGQNRNYVGEPFQFDGVIHQEPKGLIITLNPNALFDQPKARGGVETVGNSGKGLLEEAADWVKRNYFSYPLRIESYARSQSLSDARVQMVSKQFSGLLLLPRGDISANGTEVSESEEEKIDIVIANR